MSVESKETVADIMSEMREYADSMEKHLLYDLRECATDYLRVLADRIEDAVNRQFRDAAKMIPHEEVAVSKMETTTPTSEKSSAVGNAAAMREALDMLLGLFDSELVEYSDSCDTSDTAQIQYVIDKANAALSAPPRNCDRFATLDDARNAFFADYVPDETCSSAAAFAIWIFDEVKGESK